MKFKEVRKNLLKLKANYSEQQYHSQTIQGDQEEIKFAEEKLARTKQCARLLEHELNEYRGALTPLSTSLDGDMNKAVSILEHAIHSLEAYIATTSHNEDEFLQDTTQATSIARKGDEKAKEVNDEHADSDSPTNKSN
jgi:hypothetical protein